MLKIVNAMYALHRPFQILLSGFITLSLIACECDTTCSLSTPENINLNFEECIPPEQANSPLSKWDNEGKPEVIVTCSFEGAFGSKGAAQVTLTGNDGEGKNGWTGGGLVIDLTCDTGPINISNSTYLVFDIKVSPGSQLELTTVKLEDAGEKSSDRPELFIKSFSVVPDTTWRTVKIPLKDFTQREANWADWWRPVDLRNITKFITVSVNNATINNGDGTLFIDNLHFSN